LKIQAGNPSTSSGFGKVFTKANGSGYAELFYKDDNGNTARLTNQGGVGYWDQSVYAKDVKIQTPAADQFTNTQDAFCCAFGSVTGGNSSFDQQYNMKKVKRNGTGDYTVTLNFTATSTFNWMPQITVRKISSSKFWGAFIYDQSSTTVSFYIYNLDNGSAWPAASYADADFNVIVFGANT
jgi:hypothetical protein